MLSAKLLGKLLLPSEVTAGSREERSLARLLAKQLEERGWSHGEQVFEATSWRSTRALIEADGSVFEAEPLPYTVESTVEGRIAEPSGDVEEAIVVAEWPWELVDDPKPLILDLAERGAAAVVLYDPLPGRLRKSVVTGCESYCIYHSCPLRIPVVCVERSLGLKLIEMKGSRARLQVEARLMRSESINVYAVVSEARPGEPYVALIAHYDRWFRGVGDNALGVVTALASAEILEDSKLNLVLAFTAAEESGWPDPASWYWGWGAYKLPEAVDVQAAVVLDCLYPGALRASSGFYPLLAAARRAASLRGIGLGVEVNDSPFESSVLGLGRGVPAVTLNSLPCGLAVYHTNLDSTPAVSIARAAALVARDLSLMAWRSLSARVYEEAARMLFEDFEELGAPLEVRLEAYRFLQELSPPPDTRDAWRAWVDLYRSLVSAALTGDGDLIARMYADLVALKMSGGYACFDRWDLLAPRGCSPGDSAYRRWLEVALKLRRVVEWMQRRRLGLH